MKLLFAELSEDVVGWGEVGDLQALSRKKRSAFNVLRYWQSFHEEDVWEEIVIDDVLEYVCARFSFAEIERCYRAGMGKEDISRILPLMKIMTKDAESLANMYLKLLGLHTDKTYVWGLFPRQPYAFTGEAWYMQTRALEDFGIIRYTIL